MKRMTEPSPTSVLLLIFGVIVMGLAGYVVINTGSDKGLDQARVSLVSTKPIVIAWAVFLASIVGNGILLLYIRGSDRFVSITMFVFALGLGYWYRADWGLVLTAAVALALISHRLPSEPQDQPKEHPSTT